MTPELSIIIVTYNSASCIEACLRALDASCSRPFEVIVVDNASQDDTCARVRHTRPDALLLPMRDNLGFAVSNNIAARRARAPILLLLNSDTVPTPGSLDRMIDALRANPRRGVVGPRLVGDDGEVQISFGRMIGFVNEAAQKLLGSLYLAGFPPARWYVRRRSRREQRPDWVSGAVLMSWSQIYQDVGGMDENFFMYTEEVDLCARIRARGYHVLYEPRAEVLHIGGVSSQSNRHKTVLEYRRSQLYFYLKHHGQAALERLRFYLLLKFSLRRLLLAARQRLGGVPAGEIGLTDELLAMVRSFDGN